MANPLNEWRAAQEYWALREDPVFNGTGLPRGQGQLVLALPGLFGNDFYLATLRDWLNRLGYQPLASKILWNVGCANRLMQQVETELAPRLQEYGGEIAIIGHSRGGMLAKALTSRLGDRVKNLIVVGSPLGGMLRTGADGLAEFDQFMQGDGVPFERKLVFNAGREVTRLFDPNCASPACNCSYMDALFEPLSHATQLTSIYSVSDPIVSSEMSHIPGAKNLVVEGSHSGLMFNKQVFAYIAAALAKP